MRAVIMGEKYSEAIHKKIFVVNSEYRVQRVASKAGIVGGRHYSSAKCAAAQGPELGRGPGFIPVMCCNRLSVKLCWSRSLHQNLCKPSR